MACAAPVARFRIGSVVVSRRPGPTTRARRFRRSCPNSIRPIFGLENPADARGHHLKRGVARPAAEDLQHGLALSRGAPLIEDGLYGAVALVHGPRPVVLGRELDPAHAGPAEIPLVHLHREHALAGPVGGPRLEVERAPRVAVAVLDPLALQSSLELRHCILLLVQSDRTAHRRPRSRCGPRRSLELTWRSRSQLREREVSAPWTGTAIRSVARGVAAGELRARKAEPYVDAVDTETEDELDAVPADRARRPAAPRRHGAYPSEERPCRQA